MELHDNQVLTKAAGRARMWKLLKGTRSEMYMYGVFCFIFFRASVTPDFMYGKLLHARNWLKQVP